MTELPPLYRALQALDDLNKALSEIREPVPFREPGTEPSAAENCKNVLQMMDFGIKQISTYLGVKLP